MGGVVSLVTRIICHIPTGMMGFNGRTIDNTAKGVPDLDVFSNGHIFQQGLHVVGVAGICTFSWNFVMFPLSFFCGGGRLLAIVGVVDLALASALLAGVSEQSRFLPRTYAACSQATDWRNGTDGRNFFVAAATLPNGTMIESPYHVCKRMVHNWALTIAVSIIYLLCGSINVVLGTFESICRRLPRHSSTSSYYISSTNRSSSPRYQRFFQTVCVPFDMVVSPCRYTVRYLSKLFWKMKERNEIRLKTVRTRKQQACEDGGVMPPSRPLPFDVRVLISPQLHFADLVNLSRSSKLLRWRILGEAGAETSLEDLRRFTCNVADRSQCFVCNIQICSTCSTQVAIQDSAALRHLKTCRAYCRKCFYSVSRQWKKREGLRTNKHREDCRLSTNSVLPNNTSSQRALCRFCAAKTRSDREQILEARDWQEARRLARLPLACDCCMVLLPSTGPRWWVCSTCSAECSDLIHPPWATPV